MSKFSLALCILPCYLDSVLINKEITESDTFAQCIALIQFVLPKELLRNSIKKAPIRGPANKIRQYNFQAMINGSLGLQIDVFFLWANS